MTKLDYSKTNKSDTAFLNDPYWTDPKKGFDRAWHTEQANKRIREKKLENSLGIHKDHNWEPVKIESGPHVGKAICNTCGGKFIMWLPKNYFTNT